MKKLEARKKKRAKAKSCWARGQRWYREKRAEGAEEKCKEVRNESTAQTVWLKAGEVVRERREREKGERLWSSTSRSRDSGSHWQ